MIPDLWSSRGESTTSKIGFYHGNMQKRLARVSIRSGKLSFHDWKSQGKVREFYYRRPVGTLTTTMRGDTHIAHCYNESEMIFLRCICPLLYVALDYNSRPRNK